MLVVVAVVGDDVDVTVVVIVDTVVVDVGRGGHPVVELVDGLDEG